MASADILGLKRDTTTGALIVQGLDPVAELKRAAILPAGAIDASFERGASSAATVPLGPTGRLAMVGVVEIPAGRPVTTMSLMLGSTLTVTPTNQWFALVRASDRAVLAKTVDDTTTVTAINTVKTLALSSVYTPTVDTTALFSVVFVAATIPTMIGGTFSAVEGAIPPILYGWSTTGLTDPPSLGATAAAIAAVVNRGWCWIS